MSRDGASSRGSLQKRDALLVIAPDPAPAWILAAIAEIRDELADVIIARVDARSRLLSGRVPFGRLEVRRAGCGNTVAANASATNLVRARSIGHLDRARNGPLGGGSHRPSVGTDPAALRLRFGGRTGRLRPSSIWPMVLGGRLGSVQAVWEDGSH